jgi:uncharacterized cupin superfamily protein
VGQSIARRGAGHSRTLTVFAEGGFAVEVVPGFYSSSASTEDWEQDSDPPGEVHVLCENAEMEAGLWRPLAGVTPDPVSWTLPAREAILVLEGRARIEIEGGPTLELKAGSMASLPSGARTTWHLTADFKEFWVLTP